MREISLYVPEAVANDVLRRLEDNPTLVALAAIPTRTPAGHVHLTAVVPEAAFNDVLDLVRRTGAPREGIVVSRSLAAVEGERATRIRRAIGQAESEAVAWEEVVQQLDRDVTPGPVFLLFIALASLIAVSALIAGSIPVLIGAMVIPPALSSLMAISVALLMGRWRLGLKGLVATGFSLLLSIGVAWGVAKLLYGFSAIPAETSILGAEIVQERTQIGLNAYVVALAAGIAGGLSAVTNRPSQLVGVMIAAALIPSAATVGLGLAREDLAIAGGALRLLGINLGLIIAGSYLAALGLRWQNHVRWLLHGSTMARLVSGPSAATAIPEASGGPRAPQDGDVDQGSDVERTDE